MQAKTLYGIVAVLVALLIMTSTVASYYYFEDQRTAAQNQGYIAELDHAIASYNSLSGSYNSSLGDYNLTLSLLVTAVVNLNTSTPAYRTASSDLASLWTNYEQLASSTGRRAIVYGVHLLVDFGNGTGRWYNDTAAQPGWNGYVVTLVLLDGNVQAAWYPQYGEHLVTGVDGVQQTASKSWFVWDFSGGRWSVSQTGADQLSVINGTALAWTLCGYDANYNPTCTP